MTSADCSPPARRGEVMALPYENATSFSEFQTWLQTQIKTNDP